MKEYLNLLERVRINGVDKPDRTGTGIREIFGAQLRFNLQDGFPLLTTKKMFVKGVIHELLWMLSGSTNIKYLVDNGVHIWDEWVDENGDLGPLYGQQWRRWRAAGVQQIDRYSNGEFISKVDVPFVFEVDQIKNVIESIKKDPNSRRHVVSAWNPGEIDQMALAPCHGIFQFNVQENRLNCQLYQRSADLFLGAPFNIASYSLLTMMVAQVCELQPGEFIHTFGSAHIYHNHFDQVDEQLSRKPYPAPLMGINPAIKNIDDFKYEDFKLINYKSHAKIEAPVAV